MTTRKTIAVVEDNRDNRLLIRSHLGDFYDVWEYATSYEALQGIKKNVPDLIILDISLPGIDGVELLERLRAEERLKHIPAIALTAHAMTGDREHYLAAGFDDYVAKPIVDEQTFLTTIQRFFPQ